MRTPQCVLKHCIGSGIDVAHCTLTQLAAQDLRGQIVTRLFCSWSSCYSSGSQVSHQSHLFRYVFKSSAFRQLFVPWVASRDTESSMGAALSVPAPFLYGSCQVVPALARTPPVQAVPADLLAAMKPRQRWSPDPVPVGTHRQRRAHPVLRLELLSGSRRMLRSYCRGRYDGPDHRLMRVHLRLPMFFLCAYCSQITFDMTDSPLVFLCRVHTMLWG